MNKTMYEPPSSDQICGITLGSLLLLLLNLMVLNLSLEESVFHVGGVFFFFFCFLLVAYFFLLKQYNCL